MQTVWQEHTKVQTRWGCYPGLHDINSHWQTGSTPEGSIQSQPHYIWHGFPIICLRCVLPSNPQMHPPLTCCCYTILKPTFLSCVATWCSVACICGCWSVALCCLHPSSGKPLNPPFLQMFSPPPSLTLHSLPLMDLADLVGHATATRSQT